jgi:hypothetical protein
MRGTAEFASRPDGDGDRLQQAWRLAIAEMPLEMRERLAVLFTPGALRRARNQRRLDLYGACAIGKQGSASEIARQILGELRIYEATAWQNDKFRSSPMNPAHLQWFAVMKAFPDLMSERSLRRLLKKLAT